MAFYEVSSSGIQFVYMRSVSFALFSAFLHFVAHWLLLMLLQDYFTPRRRRPPRG